MKKHSPFVLFTLMIASLTCSIHCGTDDPLESAPLEGRIAGETWKYKYSKSFFNEVDNVYDAELYGTQQTNDDPCSIVISGESHISIQLPNATGNYQIPAEIQVVFEQPGAGNENFRATSGFIDITSAAGGQVVGYIQANYDDSNSVEGTFSFSRCN